MVSRRIVPRGSLKRALVLALVAAAVCAAHASASQSGRRREKTPPPLPAPSEIAQPPADPPPSEPPAPATSVVVTAELVHDAAYLSSKYVETALKACAERLKEHGLPGVATAGSMTRHEAMSLAKEKAGQYVVWLQIKAVTKYPPDDIVRIDYFVFAPQSAQLMFTGKVIPPRAGRGPVVMGIPTSGRVLPSDQVKWGARQIADLVNRRLRPWPGRA